MMIKKIMRNQITITPGILKAHQLFLGPSNSGKTTALLNQVMLHAKLDRPFKSIDIVHFLADRTAEYKLLLDYGARMHANLPNLVKTCNCPDEEPCNCEYPEELRELKKLLILEDLSFTGTKGMLDRYSRLFGCISTHCNYSVYVTAQTIGQLKSPELKKQIKSIFLWKTDVETMRQIADRYGIPKKYLDFYFKFIWSNPHDFLLIRNTIPLGKGKYLHNMYDSIDDQLIKFNK